MTAPFRIPVLETPRLVLREPKDSDALALGGFMSSPRAKWIGGPYPATDAPDWLAHQRSVWERRGWGSSIAALRQEDTPIGRIGLLDHQGWDEPELAWSLFEGFEGQGYAFEAAAAARAHANGPLGLAPLFSFIEPTNERSKALALRLGARLERSVTFKNHDLGIYRHPTPEPRA
jgi:RimJ/RimL family protein N-acetyltransferase